MIAVPACVWVLAALGLGDWALLVFSAAVIWVYYKASDLYEYGDLHDDP